MGGQICCTAASLRAMLQYIDPAVGPKIAYDDDKLAEPLIEKIKFAVGDFHGSQSVSILFTKNEEALYRQFKGVAKNISGIFSQIGNMFE